MATSTLLCSEAVDEYSDQNHVTTVSNSTKKVKQLARKSALTYKAQENAIIAVENFNIETPKTKEFLNIAKNLKVDGKKILLVLPEVNKNVYLSARNLQKVEIMTASEINTYKILNADMLVVAENSFEKINATLIK